MGRSAQMSEPFLEEQLRRIRQMSARISEARNRQQEVSREIERKREQRHAGPLENVHDFRANPAEPLEPHESADDRPARRRHVRTRHR
jgi:hypothetical protein